MTALAKISHEDRGDTAIVRVGGEIDLSNVRVVADAVAGAIPTSATHVVLDLGQTTYIDSSGIGMLFRLAQRLGYTRQELRLVVPPGSSIRRVLEITRVHLVIPVDEQV